MSVFARLWNYQQKQKWSSETLVSVAVAASAAAMATFSYSTFDFDTKFSVSSLMTAACAAAPLNNSTSSVMISQNQTTLRNLPPANTTNKSSFMVVYDHKTRNPLYTIEKLHKADFYDPIHNNKGSSNKDHASLAFWEGNASENEQNKGGGHKNRPPFYQEQSVSTHFRVNPKDFNDTKFDRGHMTPAADFSHNETQYKQTFTMCNVAAQAPMLNRGIWERLEAWIRHYLLQFHFEEIVVMTGPVFAPVFVQNQWVHIHHTIGSFPHLITVPSHFYKVILGKTSAQNEVVIAAFMLPNHNHVDKMEPLANLLVRLDQLESIVGYNFFPVLLDEKDKEKLDSAVPPYRDLTTLLNAQQTSPLHIPYLLPANSNSIKTNNSLAVVYNNRALKDGYVSGFSGLKMRHLCGHANIDCNKTMFPK